MNISKNKSLLIVILVAALLLISAIAVWSLSSAEKRVPIPTSTSESNFLLSDMYYTCSKKINGKYVEANIGVQGSPGYYFKPDNEQDLQKYCRIDSVIEYHAVIDMLKHPDVAKVIEQYDISQAWVKALNAQYIIDKDYMHRILPAYKNMSIHCVVVVHSPGGTRYFLEDGDKDHEYIELPSEVFLASLNQASDADVTNFWLGLH